MKKIVLVFAVAIALLSSSCEKNKCWIIVDCIGNDLQSRCGTESDIQSYCASQSPPGCTWTYREE